MSAMREATRGIGGEAQKSVIRCECRWSFGCLTTRSLRYKRVPADDNSVTPAKSEQTGYIREQKVSDDVHKKNDGRMKKV